MCALCMEHVRREPSLATLAFAVLCLCGWWVRELVLFDFGDAWSCHVHFAFGCIGLRCMLGFGFLGLSFRFRSGIEGLQSTGCLESDP